MPAAGTLGLVSNSAVRLQIDGNGAVGIGIAPTNSIGLYFAKNITGNTDSRGIQISSAVQSDVTGSARIFFSAPSTQATAFTIGTLSHFQAAGATVGAGSTIGTQNGFLVSAALKTADTTNAFGFRGLVAATANAWNAYMDGTAANYFAGQTVIGSTLLNLGAGSVAQQFGVVAGAATTVGVVIRGAASQTANLQQWQNSGATVVASVDASGNIRGTSVRSLNDFVSLLEANSGGYVRLTRQTAATPNPGANLGSLYFRDGTLANTLKLVARAGTAGAETTIFDNIPTT